MKNRTALEYEKIGQEFSENTFKKLFQTRKTVVPFHLFYGIIYGGNTITFKRFKNKFFTIPSEYTTYDR